MFKNLLLGFLDTIVEVAPQFVDTLLVVLEQLLASLNEHVPAMVDFILTFLIQVITVLQQGFRACWSNHQSCQLVGYSHI